MEAASAIATNSPLWPNVFTSKWPQMRPQFLNFVSPRGNRVTLFLPPRCCTKPNDTEKPNSGKEEHSSISNSLPISTPQPQGVEGSGKPLSSDPTLYAGLIFDLGVTNSWDSLDIGSPVVKRYLGDEEERWYMWYHGRSAENYDSIGLAVSRNGIHWERGSEGVRSNADVGLVMSSSKDWWAFDTHGVRPCEVVMMSSAKLRANSSVYWLYYSGFTSENIEFDNGGVLRSLPGLAMSQDGRHWARIEGEHHTGALLEAGSSNWDSSFIASPQVVFHSPGDLRMYYHSLDTQTGKFAIGVARSRDGMKWIKLGKVLGAGMTGAFDERGVVNGRVIRNQRDDSYFMVYEGVDSKGRTSIGVAKSRDGLKEWRRLWEGGVLERSGDGWWDCGGVGSPCLVRMEGESEGWRLYYRGVGKEGRAGIGLAVCEGDELNSFKRWSGFRL